MPRYQKAEDTDGKSVAVTICNNDGKICGVVHGPGRLVGNTLEFATAGQDGSLSAPAALNVGAELAAQLNVAVLVIDRDNLWQPDWGVLV